MSLRDLEFKIRENKSEISLLFETFKKTKQGVIQTRIAGLILDNIDLYEKMGELNTDNTYITEIKNCHVELDKLYEVN